jgi:uncharacterized protein (TIGR02757 family)
MVLSFSELKELLEIKTKEYNAHSFIELDPVSIPHRFSKKEDIEISAFLAASIAWGQRKSIVANGLKLMHLMDNAPYDFVTQAPDSDFKRFETFVHRTFSSTDCIYFIHSLRNIYLKHNGLENLFTSGYNQGQTIKSAIIHFRNIFFEIPFPERTSKHIANPLKNSAAKRINMFLRWMVRDDKIVDFGLWQTIPKSALMLPLDLHTGNTSRKLGLLNRTQNDWNAVEEVTQALYKFDSKDPIKYDFALFGLGIYEGFK